MPPRYRDIEECREWIKEYADNLDASTDDNDDELRDGTTTKRYKQALRWYDHWLDDEGVESAPELTKREANKLGRTLRKEFNGTTPLNRWDRIFAFYEWMVGMEAIETNPMAKWDDGKKKTLGLTSTTEQSRQLEDGEGHAVSQQEVRLMEKNVTSHRTRNQLCIRLLWQTGVRRNEAARLLISDLDRDEREITFRASVAKNDEERVIAYQQSLDGLLERWLDSGLREEMLGGRDHDYLFCGERGAPLSGDAVNEIVKNAAIEAGINEKTYADANASTDTDGNPIPNRWKITAHNVRHGFGTYMINETDAGVWEVSKLMGHSSVTITEKINVDHDPRSGIEHGHKYGPE